MRPAPLRHPLTPRPHPKSPNVSHSNTRISEARVAHVVSSGIGSGSRSGKSDGPSPNTHTLPGAAVPHSGVGSVG
eukprot:8023552-Prorocentrum_lima.AAC.1